MKGQFDLTNQFDLENHFFIKVNYLKAVGDLIRAAGRIQLLEDTLSFAGDLIVDLADELNDDFETIYGKLLHSGGNKNEKSNNL